MQPVQRHISMHTEMEHGVAKPTKIASTSQLHLEVIVANIGHTNNVQQLSAPTIPPVIMFKCFLRQIFVAFF